jgi:hypothetical protein
VGALLQWWPLVVLGGVYLVAVLCFALSQAFVGGGAWWEPLAAPLAVVILFALRHRVLLGVLLVVCLVLWGVSR